MRAILLIDHGSVKAEANHMVSCMANLLQHVVGPSVIVRHAHMELAEPSIAQGFAECARAGADEVIAFPYMLSPGKHVTRDVPRLVAEAAREFPGIPFRVTDAFGVHEKLAELIALRTHGLNVPSRIKGKDHGLIAGLIGNPPRAAGTELSIANVIDRMIRPFGCDEDGRCVRNRNSSPRHVGIHWSNELLS